MAKSLCCTLQLSFTLQSQNSWGLRWVSAAGLWFWRLELLQAAQLGYALPHIADAAGSVLLLLSGIHLQDPSACSPAVADVDKPEAGQGPHAFRRNHILGAGWLDSTTVTKPCPAALIRISQLVWSITSVFIVKVHIFMQTSPKSIIILFIIRSDF